MLCCVCLYFVLIVYDQVFDDCYVYDRVLLQLLCSTCYIDADAAADAAACIYNCRHCCSVYSTTRMLESTLNWTSFSVKSF